MKKIYDEIIEVEKIIQNLSKYPYPVILESQGDDEEINRYTIISHSPKYYLKYTNELYINNRVQNINFWDFMDQNETETGNDDDLIFNGGFIGIIRYHLLEDIYNLQLENKSELPKVEGGIYSQAIIIDKKLNKTILFANDDNITELEELLKFSNENKVEENSVIQNKFSRFEPKSSYKEAVIGVKDYIKSGDVYEVNYTTGFLGKTSYNGIQLFNRLRKMNPMPFAAYLKFDTHEVISSSPELFFMSDGTDIWTQPMKGTIGRGATSKEDEANLKQLCQCEKNKTELVMIIDLMRNDLSKICKPGTVKVENEFTIKTYPTVYQQIANVKGKLKTELSFSKIIRALFPSGSITGAPKLRTIEIIDELEKRPRSSYTGAIGFYSWNKNSCFNVAIRTIDLENDKYTINVGGAIVWDSSVADEYDECNVKAKVLLKAVAGED